MKFDVTVVREVRSYIAVRFHIQIINRSNTCSDIRD